MGDASLAASVDSPKTVEGALEIDEVTRTYPVDFSSLSAEEIWQHPPLHLFVLVPFCERKCPFCPFNSRTAPDSAIDNYFDAVVAEMQTYSCRTDIGHRPVRSVWIGGGTPSVVSNDRLLRLIESIRHNFSAQGSFEFTFEAHPRSITAELLRLLDSAGVTRISMGVQTLDDGYLGLLGRGHDSALTRQKIEMIKHSGFELNVDMMYRLPGQGLGEVIADFEAIASTPVDHISAFPMILWDSMSLAKRVRKGDVRPQANYTTYTTMYSAIVENMEAAGIAQYAYNYFARPGRECVYHHGRWGSPQEEVLGLGPGAFSFVHGATYCTEHDRARYAERALLSEIPIQSGRKLNSLEAISRYVVLGLRFFRIDLRDFSQRFGARLSDLYGPQVQDLVDLGWVSMDDDYLVVSDRGKPHILEIGRRFYTDNNVGKLQPQYEILNLHREASAEGQPERTRGSGAAGKP